MPHVEGHISIAELLGNQQASKVSFGEQGEVTAVESKPLAPPQQKVQQPLKPAKVPTLSEAKSATQGKGFFGGIGDFLGSPQGKQTLIGVARGLDPKGVGGQLANVAESQLEGQQFAALTNKLEAGEEITSADVVGLSPQAQQQAAGIIAAKGAAGRDERRVASVEEAVQSATEFRQAQVNKIKIAPEEAQKRDDAELSRLETRLASGRLNNADTNAARIKVAEIRADAVDRNIAAQEKERRKVSSTDIKLNAQLIKPLSVFKDMQSLGAKGIFDFSDDTPDEVIGKLSVEELTNEKFMELTGKTTLTATQELELDAVRRFQGQVRVFQRQADEVNTAVVQESNSVPTEFISTIDAYLRTKTNSKGEPVTIDDENRLRVFNNPTMRAAAGVN